MSNNSELKSPGAKALREAGYSPCPRWWLTEEQLELVAYMAKQNEADVNRIREKAHRENDQEWRKKQEIDRAWAAMRFGKGST
jgi:hypothetical protein